VFYLRPGGTFNNNKPKDAAMLVLSQKLNDTIKIGDNITIKILDIRQDNVRIGIDAPRDVAVHRQEIFDAINRATTGSERNPQE
jgi:carbon storage regulator